MKRLPKKLSALIRLALADLAKVEKQPKVYRVNMGTWHEPTTNMTTGKTVCQVCFAGAVMAGTLGYAPTDDYAVKFSTEDNENAFRALDWLRQGDVGWAADELYIRGVGEKFNRRIVRYTPRTRKQFRREMFKLARDLERAGL